MNILGIDSCTSVAACGIMVDGVLKFEGYLDDENTHSQKLLPLVEYGLDIVGLTAKDIDLFAATIGPGSFTGQRIGIATVKGLAHAWDKPCVGVSSLEAMAYGSTQYTVHSTQVICPIINARRGTVYTALYQGGKEIEAPHVADLVDLLGKGYLFTGVDVRLFEELKDERVYSRGAHGGAICEIAAGRMPVGVHELLPLYLQKSQAERMFGQ